MTGEAYWLDDAIDQARQDEPCFSSAEIAMLRICDPPLNADQWRTLFELKRRPGPSPVNDFLLDHLKCEAERRYTGRPCSQEDLGYQRPKSMHEQRKELAAIWARRIREDLQKAQVRTARRRTMEKTDG